MRGHGHHSSAHSLSPNAKAWKTLPQMAAGSVEVQSFVRFCAFVPTFISHTAQFCFVSVGVPMVTASLIFQVRVKVCLAMEEVTPSSTTQVTLWLLKVALQFSVCVFLLLLCDTATLNAS